MRVLAIETATTATATALADDSGVVGAVTLRTGRQHAEALHPAIRHVMGLAGVDLADLDAIAVDVGPGLFTGIRVGVATAKALAVALGIGIVACTSLEILAAAVRAAGGLPLPVVDLRRGEVAWAFPAPAPDDLRQLPAEHGTPERLRSLLAARGGGSGQVRPLVLAGDGARRYAAELLGDGCGVELAGVELATPPVASLAVTGLSELAAGRAIDPIAVEPEYLRDADTRINWTTRHDAPGRPAVAR